MLIKNIIPIKSEVSRCISVKSTNKLFAIGEEGSLVTHNSVAQRNIITTCLLRPESWVLIGIDLKRVELPMFRKFGIKVAVDLGAAVDVLRFAQGKMMQRYAKLESKGLNNFKDLENSGPALMIMVDEAGELLSPTGTKSDEGKEADELKAEAQMIIGSIARLGRAAGVHLVLAAQRPDAKLFGGGEARENFAVRLGCGRLKQSTSQMLFGSNVGMRTPANPPGGIYLQIDASGNQGQGFYQNDSWLENFFNKHPNYGKESSKEDPLDLENLSETTGNGEIKRDPLDDWDEDMDMIMEAGEDDNYE